MKGVFKPQYIQIYGINTDKNQTYNVCGQQLLREANSFSRAKLRASTDKARWKLLCLKSSILIRISLATSLGAGQVIFLAGINATEDKVTGLSIHRIFKRWFLRHRGLPTQFCLSHGCSVSLRAFAESTISFCAKKLSKKHRR